MDLGKYQTGLCNNREIPSATLRTAICNNWYFYYTRNTVKVGDVLTMKAGCKHTIIADTELQVIEVQIGDEISVHDKHKY